MVLCTAQQRGQAVEEPSLRCPGHQQVDSKPASRKAMMGRDKGRDKGRHRSESGGRWGGEVTPGPRIWAEV